MREVKLVTEVRVVKVVTEVGVVTLGTVMTELAVLMLEEERNKEEKIILRKYWQSCRCVVCSTEYICLFLSARVGSLVYLFHTGCVVLFVCFIQVGQSFLIQGGQSFLFVSSKVGSPVFLV